MDVISHVKTCPMCGKDFRKDRRLSSKQWISTQFCSLRCRDVGHSINQRIRSGPIEEKFHNNYVIDDNGCWLWTGSIEGYGYGTFYHENKLHRAHVFSLELDGRPVPKGMHGCHHCDVPSCVNPKHLYVGTPQQNVDDAVSRNRHCHGERMPLSKLTDEKVAEMRLMQGSHAEIARRFGVSRITAARAIKGQTWKHVK